MPTLRALCSSVGSFQESYHLLYTGVTSLLLCEILLRQSLCITSQKVRDVFGLDSCNVDLIITAGPTGARDNASALELLNS